MGNPPVVEGSMAAMADALSSRATLPQIQEALERCMTETYPVRLPHILKQLPGSEEAELNSLKRLAWETVELYVNKWARWDEGRNSARLDSSAPPLDQRIADSVRRSGSWSVYLRMTDKDFPFQQARFFEEYAAWQEIQRIPVIPYGYLERRKELAAQAEKLKGFKSKPLPWVEKQFEGPGGDDLENGDS